MIRVPIALTWEGQNEVAFHERGQRLIAEAVALWPGYYAHEIEVDYTSDRFWLWLKPTEDYEMDEGL